MHREMTRGDAWTRGLLALMSAGAGITAVLMLLASFLAMGSDDGIPGPWILIPVAVAVLGTVMGCVGAATARWAAGLLGALYLVTGSLAVVGTPVQDWTRSRFEAAMVVIFAMVAALGLTAIIVAVRTARAPSVMR